MVTLVAIATSLPALGYATVWIKCHAAITARDANRQPLSGMRSWTWAIGTRACGGGSGSLRRRPDAQARQPAPVAVAEDQAALLQIFLFCARSTRVPADRDWRHIEGGNAGGLASSWVTLRRHWAIWVALLKGVLRRSFGRHSKTSRPRLIGVG